MKGKIDIYKKYIKNIPEGINLFIIPQFSFDRIFVYVWYLILLIVLIFKKGIETYLSA